MKIKYSLQHELIRGMSACCNKLADVLFYRGCVADINLSYQIHDNEIVDIHIYITFSFLTQATDKCPFCKTPIKVIFDKAVWDKQARIQ